jgi:phosphoribosylanthranilate isomerase
MTKVKICGITNPADSQVAIDAGADAIGLIFAESPRRVTPEAAREIVQSVDLKGAVAVGVFVDETPERIIEVARFVGLHVLQLHGGEPPAVVTDLMKQSYDVVKSFRVGAEEEEVGPLGKYAPTAYLLDTYVPGRPGGTGEVFDWKIARDAKRFGRIILAGGLGVDNVLDAIAEAAPYGVDASSRLESSPGRKDHDAVREFVSRVKSQAPQGDTGEPWPR